MTEPTPNLPLLRAVLAQIDATPERWEQRFWATKKECGTAYCVAGWAVHISHPTAEPVWTDEYCDVSCDCDICGADQGSARARSLRDGDRDISIVGEAQRLLGLTSRESECLFGAINSREAVQTYAEQIAARAGESL